MKHTYHRQSVARSASPTRCGLTTSFEDRGTGTLLSAGSNVLERNLITMATGAPGYLKLARLVSACAALLRRSADGELDGTPIISVSEPEPLLGESPSHFAEGASDATGGIHLGRKCGRGRGTDGLSGDAEIDCCELDRVGGRRTDQSREFLEGPRRDWRSADARPQQHPENRSGRGNSHRIMRHGREY